MSNFVFSTISRSNCWQNWGHNRICQYEKLNSCQVRTHVKTRVEQWCHEQGQGEGQDQVRSSIPTWSKPKCSGDGVSAWEPFASNHQCGILTCCSRPPPSFSPLRVAFPSPHPSSSNVCVAVCILIRSQRGDFVIMFILIGCAITPLITLESTLHRTMAVCSGRLHNCCVNTHTDTRTHARTESASLPLPEEHNS